MPKIPRGLSAKKLIKLLSKFGYRVTRQTGSHIRLSALIHNEEHRITIPDHSSLKIGTLNHILNEIAEKIGKEKSDLIKELFQ